MASFSSACQNHGEHRDLELPCSQSRSVAAERGKHPRLHDHESRSVEDRLKGKPVTTKPSLAFFWHPTLALYTQCGLLGNVVRVDGPRMPRDQRIIVACGPAV